MARAGGAAAKRLPGGTEEDMVTRVAWLYYKEKLTQAQIGDQVFLSRQKVQRYLEKARDQEVIRFTLKHPVANLLGIEERLRERFGLKDAVVVPTPGGDVSALRHSFAMAGAQYLERLLAASGDFVLGVGWGNTTAYLADYFEPERPGGDAKVVSLIGNLMVNVSMNPFLTGQALASRLGCPFYNIWAPAIAQTRERAEVFKSEPWIHEVIEIARKADINIFSIGEVSRSASLFQMGYLTGRDLGRLLGKGAVGDILGRFFDDTGAEIEDEVHERVIGIPLKSLRAPSKTCIAVAGGASKTSAIAAAIRRKYFNVLITDETTAADLLGRRES